MEHCTIEKCKVNIEGFLEQRNLTLFDTYSCRYQQNLPQKLNEVGKKIVKA